MTLVAHAKMATPAITATSQSLPHGRFQARRKPQLPCGIGSHPAANWNGKTKPTKRNIGPPWTQLWRLLMANDQTQTTKNLLPCPFCGSIPIYSLGKRGSCQMHGDPFQAVIVRCNNSRCPANPRVEAGDVYNGGEAQAKAKASEKWNERGTSNV